MNAAPFILTLRFDPDSFERFDTARRRHFPADRNLIPAHLTLFHHLPGDRHAEIAATLASLAARHSAFPLTIPSLRFLGQGTAYAIESPDLMALRQELAIQWARSLTRQDAQGFRPHVTIQNKVPAARAKALHAELSASFVPFAATATGLLLWRYLGGPWDAAGAYAFSG